MYSSETYHRPPLCSIHLCWQWKALISHDGFLCITEIVHIFHGGHFDCRGAFQTVLDTDREGEWILQFQMITGACSTIVFLHSGYFDYRCTIWTVLDLYSCVTGWTWQTNSRNGYFTLRYNWGAQEHYCLMMWNAWVHQSVNIICKKS